MDEAEGRAALGVFGTTVVAFFLAEMGDKTQIATVALAAQYSSAGGGGGRHHAGHDAGQRAGGAATPATRKGNPWRLAVWGTAAGLLMFPAIAMQLGAEGVHWTGSDFVVMGLLLGSCCAAYEVATRMSGNTLYRLGFAVAILLGFLLVWINLAVGIIGGEANPPTWCSPACSLVGWSAHCSVGCGRRGMARAMVATGIAQLLAGGYALALGSMEGGMLSAAFAALWFTSAACSARRRATTQAHTSGIPFPEFRA
jgi:hypothetical protein